MTKDIARLKKITLFLLLAALVVFTAWLIWIGRVGWLVIWWLIGGGL